MADEEARRWVIVGRVQGVGYRWWARAQATRLGLEGAVWNVDDGSVEVHARGAAADARTPSYLSSAWIGRAPPRVRPRAYARA